MKNTSLTNFSASDSFPDDTYLLSYAQLEKIKVKLRRY